jgi:hypothetical protein
MASLVPAFKLRRFQKAKLVGGAPFANRMSQMYLIQLLLPLHDNDRQPFAAEYFDIVRRTLMERFGGVTAFLRSPAVGLWKEDKDDITHDEVVMFEVISSELDSDWWEKYRIELQNKFRQDEVLLWASNITKL